MLAVRWPPGPGIRGDAGVDAGDEVGTRYDPLLAKLCVHGETRARALARLRAALDDVVVLGLTTNLPLLRAVAADPEFERGGVDTGWLERTWQPRLGDERRARRAGRRRRVRRGRARHEPLAGTLARGHPRPGARGAGGARRRRRAARVAGRT